jgi:filamentous hemagglutinin
MNLISRQTFSVPFHINRIDLRAFGRKSLAVTMSVVITLQPLLVKAQEIRADQAASAANQPLIGAAANGVPLVNIVTPHASGLSHNKYGEFNVGTPGVILNNSAQDLARSQLGGLVQGNNNLRNSGPASVILNEVTGGNRSVLQGAVEVHGTAANVIIANPNGLTCDGCGFINSPRVTLSTGSPEFGADGSLSGLRVQGGDVRIGAGGADLGSVNVFDIVSRKIAIDGPVRAGNTLNLVAGANSYAYQSGLITPLPSDGNEPAIAIDSSLMGGMYAGSIKIISTDRGAGVNMAGQMAANAGAMTLSADGKLTLGKAQAKGAISARSVNQAVQVESTLFSDDAIVLEGLTAVELADQALVISKGDVGLKAGTVSLGTDALVASGTDTAGQQVASGKISIDAPTLNAGKGQIAAGALLSIRAGTIDLARAQDSVRDSLRSLSAIEIEAAHIDAPNGRIKAGDNLSIKGADLLSLTSGTYLAGGGLLVEAASLTSSASLAAMSTARVKTLSGDLNQAGSVAGDAGTTLVSAGDLINSGRTLSKDRLTLSAAGQLQNTNTGLVVANKGVTLSAGSLANAGSIGAQGGTLDVTTQNALSNSGTLSSATSANIAAAAEFNNSGNISVETALALQASNGTLSNSGTINAGSVGLGAVNIVNQGVLTAHDHDIALSLSGNLENAGTISAEEQIKLDVDGHVSTSGRIVSEGALSLQARNAAASGALQVQAGGVVNGGSAITLKAASLTNAGAVGSARGALVAELTGSLSNTGLLYSGTSSTYKLDGSVTNINGDILAETDLVIDGLTGTRAGTLDNRSGTIEAITGNIRLEVASLTNRRDGLTATVDTTSNTTTSGATTTTVVTQRETASANGPAAQILAGGDLAIDTGALVNSYSQIAANGDIDILATSILNEGRDLIETINTTAVTQHSERYCARRILGACVSRKTRYWTTTDSSTSSRTYDSVFGTIQAGGALNANVTGYLTNNAVRAQAGQIGLSSGSRALTPADIASASAVQTLADLTALNVSIDGLLGRQALFQPATAPNMPFLIETRSDFVDPSKFLGSDYFLNLIGGYDPNLPLKRLGDAYVEYRLIRDQIFNQTGSSTLGSGLDPRQLMQALYDGGVNAQQSLGLSFGIALSPSQIAALTQDIVWLERQIVQGQEVLVPRLYVAKTSAANTNIASAQIKAGQADIQTAALVNSGAIASDGDLAIDTSVGLFNNGGSLFADADIVIDGGTIVSNRSGTIYGRDVTIEAGEIINDTVAIRDVLANGFVDRAQQQARIEARGDLLLDAAGSIISEGGQFAAGNDLTLDAGRSIELSALALERSRDDRIDGGYDRAYSRTHMLAEIQAGGNARLDASEDLSLTGVKAKAGENLTLQADGDVTIASVQNQESRDLKLDIKTSGLLGTETNIRRQQSSTETEGSSLAAGDGVSIRSEAGDVTIQASRIESGGATEIIAEEGKVALLTDTDQSFSQDFKREEDLFWWNERDQGRVEETIRNVEIEAGGGLTIDAGNGVVIEYKATGGDLSASLDQLSASPGLSWVNDLRNDPALAGKVDWQAVNAEFREWDYKSQGLTEAGAALVTLVATALTAGTGVTAAMSTSLTTSLSGGAAMNAALNAGLQTLINKTAVSLVNNQGDLGATLKELGSADTLRSLATAMVTAGLTTQVLSMAGIPDVAADAGFSQNLINEAQRNLIKAAIRAGVGMTIGGEDPGQALTSALRLAAADTVGAVLANEIGDLAAFNGLKEGSIEKVVLHAAVGCAAATLGSGECMAGAIGSGLAELIGKPLAEAIPDPARQTALLSLIAGAAGAIAGGSADALNAAASQAATTHQNNYLNHAEEQEFTQALAACQRGDQSACQRADALRDLSDQRDQTLEACVGQSSQTCIAARLELRIAAAEFLDAALKAGGDNLEERALMGRHMLFLQAWQHADDADLAGGTEVAALAQRFQSEEARKLITGSKQDIESVILDPILLGVILAGGHGNGKQIVGGGTGGSKGNGFVKPGQGEMVDGGVPNAPNRKDWPELSGSLRDAGESARAALRGEGPINYGMGTFSRDQTMAMGEAWVGPGYRVTSRGFYESADGLRQFRPPAAKPNSQFATTGTQANFEQRLTSNGAWGANGHVNVTP